MKDTEESVFANYFLIAVPNYDEGKGAKKKHFFQLQ